ncbi:ATP-binding cassette, subfamily B/ATP-binding cassette, subfamily B, MsbA [Terribacillus aidingensis]|uniref:ATP-binding cassette, subfamily B/ATP-binding cassette, subfamily B, MsbA n=1 Tax=Terribacillus aidingensis TaxID=586416 RepID=A0A285NIC7_9BACI|nr:ABC transporter ATP-binding protein [Terribacillus aidingensis]SNZ09209.1 ATP-binding cassette, subfamily B/ATP-binding cassette, subfamily B, MsbA [Terribacillus aidingensis]
MNIFRKLKEFYWPHRRNFYLSLLFIAVVTAITVVYPVILQITIDDVVLGNQYELIPILSVVFILLMLIKGVSNFLQQYLGDLFGVQTVFRMRNSLYQKLQRLSFTYYDNARTGDLMSRLTADVEGIRFFLSAGVGQLLRVILLIVISLAVMFFYSIPLALITMVSMPFLAIVVYRFDRRVHPAFRKIRTSLGVLNTRVQENISGMNTVKSLSREDFEIGRFTTNNSTYRDNYISTSKIWAKFFPLMELIGNICMVVLISYGGYLVISERLELGALVAFFSLITYIVGPLANLGFIINMFSQAKASGERLLEVLEAKEDIVEPTQTLPKRKISGHVTFKQVSLQYSKEDDLALKDISFDAPPGKVIGLVGGTGAGKTSITQLITRFYEPTSGEVYIDGKLVQDYDLRLLRQHIGFVLQEAFLFSTTIKENIAYGNPDNVSFEQIAAAAKRAQAHDFIMELPNQYDTMLGERGMGLSGGQKQRIAIARALLIDPSILILDDATSAVDMQTEVKIQKAMKEVMKNRTTFIIAHRISSVKHADEILVLDNGAIAERGTHDYLLQNGGLYQRIYDIQYQDQKAIMRSAQ